MKLGIAFNIYSFSKEASEEFDKYVVFYDKTETDVKEILAKFSSEDLDGIISKIQQNRVCIDFKTCDWYDDTVLIKIFEKY